MTKREEFLIHCMGFHGIPYIWGSDDPKKGLDCSGLAQHLLAYLKLDPSGDQTADGLKDHFSIYGKQVSDYDLGDVVFYGSKNKAIHIAIYLGNGLIIEAGGGGSRTTTKEIALSIGAQVRIRPMLYRGDFICVLRPNGLTWT